MNLAREVLFLDDEPDLMEAYRSRVEQDRAEFERRHAEDLRIINRQFRCRSRLDGSTAAPKETK